MNDVAEGFGGAIEGALTGRAVEPGSGEADLHNGDRTVEKCANCGAMAASTYCPECGQKRHVHRTLTAIGHDLIHGVLHLDGKFWLTLPLLVFRPGQLTRRYIEGERAKFVSPMAMFLFSVFAMFAVFQMVGLSVPTSMGNGDLASSLATAREQAEADRDDLQAEIAALETASGTDAERRAELEEELANTQIVLQSLSPSTGSVVAGAPSIGEAVMSGLRDPDSDVQVNLTGIESLDKGVLKKWRENPGLMLYKLQANGYKFSWLLIPLSIPFVWLTFAWRRRFKAYDHAIFVTYSLSFMSLLFIVTSLLMVTQSLGWLGGLLMVFVPPIHLYKQLRGAYEVGRFSAFWRLIALSMFIWIVVLLFLQVLLVLGAF